MLAHPMPNAFDPTGWLASEKLDGIRALWLPSRSRAHLFSRSGNPIHAPGAFVATLPAKTPLDGELFLRRGGFQRVSSIVRKKVPVPSEWQDITYQVFDSPGDGTSRERLRRAAASLRAGRSPWARPVTQTPIRSRAHLEALSREVLARGGEGVMVRDPAAPYEYRRVRTLLKVKPSLDTEGTVVRLLEGRGRHRGMLGAAELRLADGKTVRVGSGFSDAQRRQFWHPGFVGTVVTIKFMTRTNGGIPRQPVFDRIRHDAGI